MPADRRLDGAIGAADRLCIREIKLHAADVGLVGDREGMELEDDREPDGHGSGDGLVLGRSDARLDGRNAIGRQDSLRFDLGENGPPPLTRLGDNRLGRLTGTVVIALRASASWGSRTGPGGCNTTATSR